MIEPNIRFFKIIESGVVSSKVLSSVGSETLSSSSLTITFANRVKSSEQKRFLHKQNMVHDVPATTSMAIPWQYTFTGALN